MTGVKGCVPWVRVKVFVLMVEGSIASLKETVMVSLSGTLVSALAGPVAARTGAVVSGATSVVKLQLMSLVSGLRARHSFPTRRSSDLVVSGARMSAGVKVAVPLA